MDGEDIMGASSNPISWAEDQLDNTPISGPLEWVSNQLDESPIVSNPGQALDQGLTGLDDTVNDNIPGGWATVGAVTAAVLAPELLPEILPEATGAAEAGADAALLDSAPTTADYMTSIGATEGAPVSTSSDLSFLDTFSPDTGAQLGSGTSLSADAANNPLNPFYQIANPEAQANLGTVSNLVGGGAESNLANLDSLSNALLPTSGAGIGGAELGSTGSIIGSGQGLGVQTLPDTLASTGLSGLTPNDLMSQPVNIANPSVTASDLADALKKMNQLKNLFSTQTQNIANNQQTLQNNQALSNMLRASQKTPFDVPKEYRQGNPFTYAPQEPVQLASLLRKNYGNSI